MPDFRDPPDHWRERAVPLSLGIALIHLIIIHAKRARQSRPHGGTLKMRLKQNTTTRDGFRPFTKEGHVWILAETTIICKWQFLPKGK